MQHRRHVSVRSPVIYSRNPHKLPHSDTSAETCSHTAGVICFEGRTRMSQNWSPLSLSLFSKSLACISTHNWPLLRTWLLFRVTLFSRLGRRKYLRRCFPGPIIKPHSKPLSRDGDPSNKPTKICILSWTKIGEKMCLVIGLCVHYNYWTYTSLIITRNILLFFIHWALKLFRL